MNHWPYRRNPGFWSLAYAGITIIVLAWLVLSR